MGVRIEIRNKENITSALKRFKKACERAGVIRDMRRTEYYEKPSVKMRRRKLRSLINIKKMETEKDLVNTGI